MLILAYTLVAAATLLALALPFLRPGRTRDEAALAGGILGDLEVEKATILAAIRDLELERQSGKVGEEDYAEFRRDYEARAARVLQQIDAARASIAAAAPAARAERRRAPAAAAPRSMLPYAVGGVALLAVGVAGGYLLATYSPGSARPSAAAPGAAASSQIGALESALARKPEDTKAKLALAHAYLDAGRFGEAIGLYRQVLDKNPRDPEALTHMGVILTHAGHADAALQMFDRALAVDPMYAHALWDKASLLFEQRQDYAGAARTLEAFIAVASPGPDVERAKAMIAEAKKRLAEASAPAAPPAPAAPAARQSLR
jgi:cytochrome c-type biogenesis protein CcmH/NrfG